MSEIIEELGKNYNIPEKQMRILRALETKDLNARAISKETKIPIGRLYEHLNKLINSGLIEKSGGNPSTYSFKNKEEKIYTFVKSKFQDAVKKETLILSVLKKDYNEIKILKSMDEFVMESRKIHNEPGKIYFIERKMTVPYFFYPENNEKFIKVRKIIKKKRKTLLENESLQNLYKESYFESIKTGKKFIGVTNKKAVQDFFNQLKQALGNKEFQNNLKDIINLIEKNNVECRLHDESFPFYMVISKDSVLILFVVPEKLAGLYIKDKDAVIQFLDFFYSIYNKSEPILPYLKQFLEKD